MSQSPLHSAAGSLLCGEDAGEVISGEYPPPLLHLPSYSPPSDEESIDELIDAETEHMPDASYLRRCRYRLIDVAARQNCISWILKVHAFYHFSAVTACLSVNYLDRFLSCSSLPRSSGWAFQLLAVACLSLAAKMEEPEVPLLLDLQLFDPRFVFERKTIQRMELWVMANLRWRLRSVTPFDYLDYFISRLPSSSDPKLESMTRIFSDASDLIISTTRGIDFLAFPPSTIAAAAVLWAAGRSLYPPCFHDREMVRSCHQLMEQSMVDTCLAVGYKSPLAEPAPPYSPAGVLDAFASGSCDTRSENPGSGAKAEVEAEAEAEAPIKRLRSSAPDA